MPVVEHAPPQSKGRSGEDAVPNAARASTPGPAYPCFRGLRLPARCCTCVAVLAWRCEMCVPGGHEDSMTRLGSKIENHVHGTWRRVPVRSGFSGAAEESRACDPNRILVLYTIHYTNTTERRKRCDVAHTRASHLFDNTHSCNRCAAPHRPVLQLASGHPTHCHTPAARRRACRRRRVGIVAHERGRASRPRSRASLGERRRAASPKAILRATALPRIGQGCIAHVLLVPPFSGWRITAAGHRSFYEGCTLPR